MLPVASTASPVIPDALPGIRDALPVAKRRAAVDPRRPAGHEGRASGDRSPAISAKMGPSEAGGDSGEHAVGPRIERVGAGDLDALGDLSIALAASCVRRAGPPAILAPMPSPMARRVLGFAFAAATLVSAVLGVAAGCGPDQTMVWFCLNPVTGKVDDAPYDANHYVNGVFDPCHCFDPCGPEKSCPEVVDAGPAAPGCDAGPSDDAGGG